jgi:hypothetical protein
MTQKSRHVTNGDASLRVVAAMALTSTVRAMGTSGRSRRLPFDHALRFPARPIERERVVGRARLDVYLAGVVRLAAVGSTIDADLVRPTRAPDNKGFPLVAVAVPDRGLGRAHRALEW